MKGLASFIMRGRMQALLVAVAGAGSLMFCWLSAAAIALVTLRRGAGSGAWLLLWAVLPATVLLLAFGDSSPLALLLGTATLALVLRITVNLPLAILASVPVGLVTGAAVAVFGGAMLDQMIAVFDQFLASLEQQMAPAGSGAEVTLLRPTALQVAGMLGVANGLLSVLCLLLARWWQAALYNPGGFAAEFRQLYYPPAISALLLLVALGLASQGVQWRPWAAVCLLPLTFAGLALLHARQALRGGGSGLLVGFYLTWVFFDLVKILVVIVAVADSWLQWRQRWAARRGTDVDRRDDNDDRD